jgi:hypothetical protein
VEECVSLFHVRAVDPISGLLGLICQLGDELYPFYRVPGLYAVSTLTVAGYVISVAPGSLRARYH